MSADSPSGSSTPLAPTAKLVCPRCDYSLRGLPSPRCPECGVEFRWEDLGNVDEARTSGFFEYCLPSDAAKCFVHTWWRALHPVSFWNWATPSWPVQRRRIRAFAVVSVLATVSSLTLVMTVLHFAMLHWYHGSFRVLSVAAFARSLLPLYGLISVVHVLPCFVAGTLLWCCRGTVAQSPYHPRCLFRLVAYPAAFLTLLAIAVPARLISTLFVYSSRSNADWATVFWWLQPNGHWSERVYARMFGFDWFMSGFDWSNPLRIATLCALAAVCLTMALPNSSPAKYARYVGFAILVLLWPVAMVYVGWFVSLTLGAYRYLPSKRGWLAGAVTGVACIVLLLVADLFLGGGALFDVMRAWP